MVGEAAAEERGLPLLVLRGGGQHVVCELCGLRHGHVDHHDQVESPERLAHALAVGQRVHRVAALYECGAEAVGMVREDLVWK